MVICAWMLASLRTFGMMVMALLFFAMHMRK